MTARVSLPHANRQAHNWLVYEDGDRILTDRIPDYKGILCNLGCGEAPYRAFFEQYVDRYIGIDWSESLHAIHADIIADLNAPLPMASEVRRYRCLDLRLGTLVSRRRSCLGKPSAS